MDLRQTILSKAQSAVTLKREVEDCVELGIKIGFRGLMAGERADCFALGIKEGDGADATRKLHPLLIMLAAFDPDKAQPDKLPEPLFDVKDAPFVLKLDGALLLRWAQIILRLSGMTKQAEGEISKNSSSGIPNDGSTSD